LTDKHRPLILSAILALLCAYGAFELFGPPKVHIVGNRIVKSNYNFIYEHWMEEKLTELRKQEGLEGLRKGCPSEFELFLRLCDWTRNQWKFSEPVPYPLCNAVDILKDIRSGRTGGFCGQYAYVLADVLKSMGYFSVRYLELWSDKGVSHFALEVWSDDYQKWMVLDPTNNCYFRFPGSKVPANAYDVQNALRGREAVEAVLISGVSKVLDDAPKKADLKSLLPFYANFAVSLRSDLMRHTKFLTAGDRLKTFLYLAGPNTSGKGPFYDMIPYANVTQRVEDLYYDCNSVRVEPEAHRDRVLLRFYTDSSMPSFKGFLLRPGRDAEEIFVPYQVEATRRRKIKEFFVTPVNMAGIRGVSKEIDIDW